MRHKNFAPINTKGNELTPSAKRILNQLESENHLSEEELLKLGKDPLRFKQIVDQFDNGELQLEQSIIEALNSIPVPEGLKDSIMEKIRSKEQKETITDRKDFQLAFCTAQ